MTKQEIQRAIENGESVWALIKNKITKVRGIEFCSNGVMGFNVDLFAYHQFTPDFYNKLFKTKAEAEHYLHHANVVRTEELPFLTWEEFKDEKELFFTNKSGYPMCLCIIDTKLGKKIGLGGANGYFDLQQYWDLTEANFYKAYDECVRLFKGEE